MTQYIVTGASGFVGKNLVLELAKKEKNFIYAVVRNEDSDTKREVNEAVDKIMETLNYTNLVPDEYE